MPPPPSTFLSDQSIKNLIIKNSIEDKNYDSSWTPFNIHEREKKYFFLSFVCLKFASSCEPGKNFPIQVFFW